MKRTQREQVLDLLRARGERGVSAREAIYDMGITRLAAIVFDLRADGHIIETIDMGKTPDGRQSLARYVLHKRFPCARCGHEAKVHPSYCAIIGCSCTLWLQPGLRPDLPTASSHA